MHELITDQSFEINNTNEYKLSIQLSLDGFSFLVTHKTERRLLALKNTRAIISSEKFLARRFAEWANSEEILSKPFAAVSVCFTTPKFTLVPHPFFVEEEKNAILNFLFDEQVPGEMMANNLDRHNSKLLFSIPADLKTVLDKFFGQYSLYHAGTVLSHQTHQIIDNNETGATLFFGPGSFLLFLQHKENLVLANSFAFNHPNDVIYYVATALKQNNLQPQQCKVLVSGRIEKENECIELLKKYIGPTYFLLPDLKSTPESLNEPLHKFIALL